MDKEPEEMQHPGVVEVITADVVGMITEAFKLMRPDKLLPALARPMLLPALSFSLACHLFTEPLRDKMSNQTIVDIYNALMAVFFFLFILAFSLLAFPDIVYSVACIYTGNGVSLLYSLPDRFEFQSFMPRVWKRLTVTFLWAYLIVFAYQVVGVLLIVICAVLADVFGVLRVLLFGAVIIAALAVVVWLKMIWEMASVVSVLEQTYGLAAVQKKSLQLLRGKWVVAAILQVIISILPHFAIVFLFKGQVVRWSGSVWWLILMGVFLIWSFFGLWLMGVIVQGILYLGCKAHHHESIDRSALPDHLDGYLGEYVPLKDPIPSDKLEP